jgi:hypothetical protein
MNQCDAIESTWNKIRCCEIFKYIVIFDLVDRDDLIAPQVAFIYPQLQDNDKHLISSQLPQFCFPDGPAFARKLDRYLMLEPIFRLTFRTDDSFFFTLKGASVLYVFVKIE